MQFKHVCISDRLGLRFEVLRQGHVFLRAALQSWWSAGGNLPASGTSFSSATVRNLVKKLTNCDWLVLYEALGAAFEDCADQVAHSLVENRASDRVSNRASDHSSDCASECATEFDFLSEGDMSEGGG